MYARLSSILFPITLVLFVGAILWGYQEHQEKNSILIKAENQYQRAFHDLNHHLSRLHEELGQTLAVSSKSHGMQRKGLVNVWRMTSQAQNEINQLPLAMLPFNKAESFLSRLSNFAYKASIRDLTKQPLSDGELKTLKTLYEKSAEISRELGKIQDAVIQNRLRWMDVEIALASENNPHDNTIIDGFRAVNKRIEEYPESDWGPAAMSTPRKFTSDGLTGKMMTAEEIVSRAQEFLGRTHARAAGGAGDQGRTHARAAGGSGSGGWNVTENGGSKSDFQTYTVTVNVAGGSPIQMDFTKKGGHLLWYMNPRTVQSRKINFDTARNKASDFLVRNNYLNMTPVTYDEYDHVAVFSFVAVKDGVRIYPDKVTVRVALDNGEIVGLQAADHLFAAGLLTPGKPKIATEEAAKGLHPDFRVQHYALAVIENDMGEQVLVHEFVGKVNGGNYRVYMNAETGVEESVEKVPDAVKSLYRVS